MQTHSAPTEHHLAPSRPFLKWTGGKQRLLTELAKHLPPGRRLIEPFVGAGSVFLGMSYEANLINDANDDLIALWTALRSRPHELIGRASSLFVEELRSREAYIRIREQFNSQSDRFERAVLLPYLNRFGFNGLFRVNSLGRYNVPYGSPRSLPNFPFAEMRAASLKLQRTEILNGGFQFALEQAGIGDVLYCDPPYLDSAHGRSFTAYGAAGFSLAQHEELRELALTAVSRGAAVVISNHDTAETRRLYRNWRLHSVVVRRSIAAQSHMRLPVPELIAVMP